MSLEIHWTLGDRLAKARRAAGFDQQQLAAHMGVSRATVSAWERDRNLPEELRYVVTRWAEITGADRDWLLWGDEGTVVPRPKQRKRQKACLVQSAA